MGDQDHKLVNEFLAGRSESSFRNLYRAYTPRLYQMAYRLTGQNVHLTDELIQETWVRAIRKLEGFQYQSGLLTWLTGILININRERCRDSMKQDPYEAFSAEEPTLTIEITIDTLDLEKAIASLPPGYRQILILHDVEGFKHKDIATLLNISEGTSKSQLHQARKAMRKFLLDN